MNPPKKITPIATTTGGELAEANSIQIVETIMPQKLIVPTSVATNFVETAEETTLNPVVNSAFDLALERLAVVDGAIVDGWFSGAKHQDLLPCLWPNQLDTEGKIRQGLPSGGFDPRCQSMTALGLTQTLAAAAKNDLILKGNPAATNWDTIDGIKSDTSPHHGIANVVGLCIHSIERAVVTIDWDLPVAGLTPDLKAWIGRIAPGALLVRGNRVRLTMVMRQSKALRDYLTEANGYGGEKTKWHGAVKDLDVEMMYGDRAVNNIWGRHKSGEGYELGLPGALEELSLGDFQELEGLLTGAGFTLKRNTSDGSARITLNDLRDDDQYDALMALCDAVAGQKLPPVELTMLLSADAVAILQCEMVIDGSGARIKADRKGYTVPDGCRQKTSWVLCSDVAQAIGAMDELGIAINRAAFDKLFATWAGKVDNTDRRWPLSKIQAKLDQELGRWGWSSSAVGAKILTGWMLHLAPIAKVTAPIAVTVTGEVADVLNDFDALMAAATAPPKPLDVYRGAVLAALDSRASATIDAVRAATTIDDLTTTLNGGSMVADARLRQSVMVAVAIHLSADQTRRFATATATESDELLAAAGYALATIRAVAAQAGDDIASVLGALHGDKLWVALSKGDPQLYDYVTLTRGYGHRMRYNALRKDCEMDGVAIDLDRPRLDFVTRHAHTPRAKSDVTFAPIVQSVCTRNTYNPIVDYLADCKAAHGDGGDILTGMSKRYFSNNSVIAQVMLVKTLIAAVARIYNPGCKVDTVLVLQGDQGVNKSSFFRDLSQGYFTDSMGEVGDKDEILKAARAWFVEWGEINCITGKKGIERTKAFLSSQVDLIRMPYGRTTIEMPRAFIIVGSSNPKEILHDETGDRRFWPIAVQGKINRGLLRDEVDQIWAAAVALYESGAEWWLTDDEELLAATNNEEFKSEDVWQETIEGWLTNPDNWDLTKGGDRCVRIAEVIRCALDVRVAESSKATQMRVVRCLTELGFTKSDAKQTLMCGKRAKVWTR
jgi:predicted P-loop ATPase